MSRQWDAPPADAVDFAERRADSADFVGSPSMRHGSSIGGGVQPGRATGLASERVLELLSEVAAVLIGTESLAGKLDRCAQEIVVRLGLDRALIWSADAAGAMKLVASAGGTDGVALPAQMVDSLVGAVVEQRRRVVMRAFAGYPLLSDDTLLGVLAVGAREALEPDALETLAVVASQVAMGIERRRRLEEREHLLARVAHDLRNPLSAIVTATALLKRVPVAGEEPRWRKHLQTISNSVERMNRLILDLLDAARIEAGRLQFTLTRHPLSSLMGELTEHYLPIAEGKGLRLEVQDESRAEIAADRGRLLQAMFNLLDNAFKFSPPGGTVSVRALRRGSEVVVRVTDAGPGITEADQAHVFQPYWQADPRSSTGLGLGLSIAKGVIEAHRGRIWFESTQGGGTTFFVSLPAISESATDQAQLAH